MPTANYLEAGSELKIKVNLAYPLNSKGEQVDTFPTEKPGVPTEVLNILKFTKLYLISFSWSKRIRRKFKLLRSHIFPLFLQCPFGRLVYIFKYTNSKFLRRIQKEITAINAEALELDSLPQHVIQAALSTYKLSK